MVQTFRAGRRQPGGVPSAASVEPVHRDRLREKERTENFPVALRVLPRAVRADLLAVYDVVRTIDDLGDELTERAPGERTAALEAFAADLALVWSTGEPAAPVLARLVPAVRRSQLPHTAFDRLVRANLVDQQVSRYATRADLLGYCDLSAAPIGELVLRVFGQSTPERIALSDRVCAGLQVAEHLQDVAEDRRAGRVYLPQEDLDRAGVAGTDLDAAVATPALRGLVAEECAWVAELLAAGPPLVAGLTGWARIAVAGYVAGGRAALDGLRRAGGDVLVGSPGTRKRDVARHGLALLARRAAR